MLNHVVIWQGEKEQAKMLTAGMELNKYKKIHVVCSPTERNAFAGQLCFDPPGDDANAQEWQQVLQEIYVAIAQNTPAHTTPGAMVLNYVVSSAFSASAYDRLCAMCSGASKIPGMEFAVHIIVLLDTVSGFAKEQENFLLSLQQDVSRQAAGTQSRCWNRLSVLSDWSSTGAASLDISQTRQDILCGVIHGAEERLVDLQCDCMAYGVKRTNFGRRDVQMLPRQMLYKSICKHRESGNDADRAFLPDMAMVQEVLSNAMQAKRTLLTSALLADDNNYKTRTGEELLDSFLTRNAGGLVATHEIERLADQWLQEAKRQLALWIDVDRSIHAYLQPGRELEGAIDAEIDSLNERTPYCGKRLSFGSQAPFGNRKRAARHAAAYIADRAVWQGQIDYLKAVRARIPALNEYLKAMDEVNLRYFGEKSDLVEAFSPTGWSDVILKELNHFDLSLLSMSDEDIDQYEKWLERTLHEKFFSNIEMDRKKSAEDDFVNLAVPYAKQDPCGFVMLNACFKQLQHQERTIMCLGASSRLYLLEPIQWDIGQSSISGVLASRAAKDNAKSGKDAVRLMAPRNKDKFVDMRVSLKREADNYTLEWHWPRNTDSLALSITNKSGETCYAENVGLPLLSTVGKKLIPIRRLPQGESVCIRLEGMGNVYTEKVVQIPRIEQCLQLQPLNGLFKSLGLSSAMKKWAVDIPREIIPGIPTSSCVLELCRDEHVFRYPIPEGTAKMIVLCEADREWQNVRMVLEDR